MSAPTELTQLEVAQFLRDFIRAEIHLALSKIMNDKSWLDAADHADKLFAQIAGTGEGE